MKDIKIVLSADDVIRGQGGDPERIKKSRPGLYEIALRASAEGPALIDPVVLVKTANVQGVVHENVMLEEGKKLTGLLPVQHFAKAGAVIIMACTIGGRLEEEVHTLVKTDPVYGLALDGYGTAAVHHLAMMACRVYEVQARSAGLETSIPLSPGMEGWPLAPGQQQVFELLPGTDRYGLRLSESNMMLPLKSITQVIGVGAKMELSGQVCDYCTINQTCQYSGHFTNMVE